ncbi:MAG: hypothetical protein ABIZ52_02775 [Candidatus Limnocylindrales bacterium]
MTNQSQNQVAPLLTGLLGAAILAACGGAAAPSASPAPSAKPTPTPIAASVATPAAAAALVIASNPLFAGAVELSVDLIGASKWWVATPLAGGGFTIVMTVGWGDCPAGCINRHVWTYEVKGDGALSLVTETGDPLASDLPA